MEGRDAGITFGPSKMELDWSTMASGVRDVSVLFGIDA